MENIEHKGGGMFESRVSKSKVEEKMPMGEINMKCMQKKKLKNKKKDHPGNNNNDAHHFKDNNH